ncbi:hypothetical protein SCLCIDRAFT_1222022 [Scleroderma citrinum Foug A]|uniref:Dipeptidase n=1 Tax=Scleroderma citrinum Foug A TaxID=1036808 RepID=A0A0C2YXU6_9AGAM|nr:hypothetical protein SCLCIDRAFT_1222022 [Scleroderma citrinum Foug A]
MSEETEPLIQDRDHGHGGAEQEAAQCQTRAIRIRAIVWSFLALIFILSVIIVLVGPDNYGDIGPGTLPRDPDAAARKLLHMAPVIDGHIDLPMVVRYGWRNNVSAIPLDDKMPMHVDILRLRDGKVGGFFWSVYVPCADSSAEGKEFVNPTWSVRDTLEQIDVAKGLITKYPETFQFTVTSTDVKESIAQGKIASLLGVEGAHQLGNSISVLRQYYDLGVRYVTLTHTCHNAFADSCGYLETIPPLHYGLSPFGFKLIEEMNRIGMLVDLSHTSDMTAAHAIMHSKAPVIWSHSSARAVHDVARNVPDEVLGMIGTGKGQKDGIIMVNFSPSFVAPDGEADVKKVADHVEHIANVVGKKHVGIGSDFDGVLDTPKGLEDVSKYPNLIAELLRRGWDKYELAGFTGGNFLRVFAAAEDVARKLQAAGTSPVYDVYEKRDDFPEWEY